MKKCLPAFSAWLLVGLACLSPVARAQDPGPIVLQGTGGTITTQGSYRVHTFTAGDTFTPPPGLPTLDALVVGGGGGGGSTYGGGGGAGGLVWQTGVTVTLPSYGVVVGAGGTGGAGITFVDDITGSGTNGGDSSLGPITALGGGFGQGGAQNTVGTGGGSGGSGGGGGGITSGGANPGGSGTVGQGNNGGSGNGNTGQNNRSGGGGGGAGATGVDGTNGAGGDGGNGSDFSAIFGTGVGDSGWFAGGGGGGKRSGGGAGGTGGTGGGGDGGGPTVNAAVAGLANTGGGGGGSGGAGGTPGADGGSGIVIVRYLPPTLTLTQEPSAAVTSTVPFAQQPVVRLLDGSGSPISGVNITASVASGGGSMGGTVTVATNGSGLANFTDLSITGTGNHTIAFTPAGGTQSVVSIVVDVQPPTISMIQQPSANATTTIPFVQQPTVELLYNGSPATGINITASIASGAGTLGGTVTVPTNGSGQAVFTDLAITGLGSHTIRFTAAGSGVTVDANVIDVASPTITITQQPSASAISGTSIAQQPVVELLYNGAPATGVNITASIASGSGTLGGTVTVPTNGSGQAVFTDLVITGLGNHTLSFSPAGFSDEVVSSLISVGLPFMQGCPGYDGTSLPVVFMSCTESKVPGPNITTTITISTPPGVLEGDLLVAAIAIDESHVVNAAPAGWNLVYQDNAGGGGQAASFNVYSKVATVSEPADYAFSDTPVGTGAGSTPAQAAKYGWIMHFRGVAGIADTAGTTNGGQTNPAIAPSVTTTSDNNMILLLGGFDDRDIVELNGVDVDPLIQTNPAFTTITMEDSHDDGGGNDGDSVSGGAAYLIQSTPGASGAQNFLAFSEGERWVTVSMALEPLPTQFRISHAGTTNNCSAPINVTIRATDDSNNAIGSYTGTIQLSTNNGFGTWGIGGGNGILTPGGVNAQGVDDGTATYTFAPADNGVVTLTFSTPMAGTTNFDIVDVDHPGIVESVDPDLNVAFCPTYEFAISNSGPTDTCTPATINFRVAQTGGGPTLFGYTGTIAINNDIMNGFWAPGSSSGTLTSGPGDGTASYTFVVADYGIVSLDFQATMADPTVNFNVDDGTFTEGGVDNELAVSLCSPTAPTIGAEQCTAGTSVNLTIDSNTTNSKRMVLLLAGSEGNTDPPAAAATFNGVSMTLIARAVTGTGGFRNMVDVFAILDAALPSGAGSYPADYSAGLTNTAEFCVMQLTDVEQLVPTSGAGQPANTSTTTAGGTSITTNIITAAANAAAVSAVATGGPVNSSGRTLTFEWEYDIGGGGGTSFIASSGIIPSAGAIGIQEQFNTTPNPARIAHNVASFSPAPFAASQFSITHNNTGSTCTENTITISAINPLGQVDPNYTGTIDISTTSGLGDYTVISGTNPIVNGSANDGDASYTFDPADNGVVVLGFTQTVAGTVNFDVDDGTFTESLFYDNDLVIGDCAFRISNVGNAYTCSEEAITIAIVDGAGNPITAYTGTINLSTSTNHGTWSGGSGGLVDGGLGQGDATYTFAPGDNGSVTLNLHDSFAETVNIDVDDGTYTTDPLYDPDITVLNTCEFRISHDGSGGTCSKDPITIEIYDPDGNPGSYFTGTINLSTTTGNGTWSVNTGAGMFSDPGADDGLASYTFAAADAGVVVLDFADIHQEVTNFNVTGSGYTVNPGFDPDFTVTPCAFRISHSGNSDQCTPEAVTITVVDNTGTTLMAYTGTINLTTDTGNGTWSLNTGAGTFNDPIGEDGAASYTFDASDNGVVVLDFTDSTAETVNMNVTDGAIFEDALYDPDLTIDLCTFRITTATGTLSACTFETITFEVYDSGGALATGFTGTVDITTSTGNGTWVSTTGAGTLTDVNPNDGIATYTFVAGDNGSVDFSFADETVETVNINLDANGLIEDPGFDPDLSVTACLPIVTDVQCYANQNQANAITLNSSAATGGSRMVLMYTSTESLTPATGATLDGGTYVMSELRNETANFGIGQILQVYGILDANLPAAGGTYSAQFTGSANGPAMCLVALEGVEQAFPNDTGDSTGQINGSNAQNTQVASTSITSVDNNAIVLSVVANGQDGTTYTSTLPNVMWPTGVADAASSDWAGSYGIQPTTGLLQVDETNNATPNRHAHIVMALAPIVAGNPYAADYVPVSLYQTYSGNINYRAIGNSLRNQPNNVNACSFVPTATGSTADLIIPASSNIVAGYLYWAGSGTEAQEDPTVTFGPVGSEISITADDMFHVINAYGLGTDFFAGYKDVTGLISTAATTTYHLSDLTVQTGPPWSTYQGCLGGWGIVVVYENTLENLNIINLFHGFQPFRYSSFQLVPRNFRMATPDGLTIPNGQITHMTFEGDDSLNEPGELLELQNDPNNLTFTALINSVNPALSQGGAEDAQYNDTISHPAYDGSLNFIPTGGDDGQGYFIDSTTSYGTDVDTYYLHGANPGDILYPFGSSEAEQITTRYGSGQDGVLLVGEFIAVTNAPIADLEVFISESGIFKVNSMGTGMYSYTVTNNGNGAITGGYADGDVVMTINLPVGMTAASINAPGWTCTADTALPNATAFTCVFEIANDWTTVLGAATNFQLAAGESLPDVEVTVNLDDETSYPLLSNPVTQSARIDHVGDYTTCDVVPVGVMADPTICSKAPQFDNVNDLNKHTIDIDDLDEKLPNNNNVVQQITNVLGIRTDLSIAKSVVGVLEQNQPAQYQLVVTNNGPDITSKTMTVTDTLPAGLVPDTAGGTDWTCNIAGQDVTCTRSAPLGSGSSSTILVNTVSVVSPAVEGVFVSNTAVVQAGAYNFDQVPGNNSDTDITEVVGAPVASNEKFLISVSYSGDTSIGGLGPFGNTDLVLYDPVTDEATMFLAEADIPGATNLNDINAVHLLPNGQVLLSSNTDGSSIAGVGFNEGDIVLYDPILEKATLVFEGSTVFTGAADLDAIYIRYNNSYTVNDWDILFSTVDDAVIAGTTYDDNDVVLYDVSAGTASLLVDGATGDVFGVGADNGDIDALYVRYQDANIYTFSTDDPGNTTIGIDGTQATYTADDLVEIDLTTPGAPDAGNVFLGDVANGIFTPVDAARKLDAVHVIEDGYYGHFAIIHGGTGDTCTPTMVTIRKHAGLTHTTDTNYEGSVLISNDIGEGTWTKDVSANGTLTDMGGGMAVYTFEAADNGEVVLYLTQTNATVMNVDVTNGFRGEAAVEDSDINISNVVTLVTYLDQFSTVAYANNDGLASFSTNWVETNDDGDPAAGAVKIVSAKLNMTNPGGSTFPAIERSIDFSGFTPNTVTDPLTLSFNWSRTNGAPADTFQVQAKSQSTDPTWTTIATIGGLTGAVASTPLSYDLTAAGITPTASTQIRFVISAGYQLESFNLDNVQVGTATNDCNIGGTVDHYKVYHSGFGISCLATYVTITPHTLTDIPTEPGLGVTLTLDTSTHLGTWGPPIGGTGTFSAVAGLGQATYTYQLGEGELTFPLNYTNPMNDPESVSIDVHDDIIPMNVELEDPTLEVATAGLRFFNDTQSNGVYPTLVAGMDSYTYTNQELTVQAIQASDLNPAACENLFLPNTDVQIELAFECTDPGVCSAATIPVSVTNNGNTTLVEPVDDNAGPRANSGGYVPMTLHFTTFTNGDFDTDPGPLTDFSYTGARIDLNYADAGALQIHGRYNIPLLDGAGALSGNNMYGSGDSSFVVRPFGYDVDVLVSGMPDRQTNGNNPAADSWATDANGSVFFTAGMGFDTTVRAISWQAADDDGSTGGVANDGIPDPGADLFDNDPTPNYGNENDPLQNDMTITHALDASMPVGAVTGTLTTAIFTNFGANNGSETHTMAWDEVGIIDLGASLDSGDYLGGGEGISGELLNLGRFIPADFTVSLTNLIDRPLFTPSASAFTYMGEEFTAEFTLTARNAATNTTQNYFGDFAKLDTPGEMSFFGIQDIAMGDDVDYSARLAVSASNGFPADFSADWSAGVVPLSGNLVFNRQAGGAPDAPLTPTIAVTVLDDDGVIDTGRNVDDDDGVTEPGPDLYNLIGVQEFRYGRLRLENAYGSEIPETAEDADDLNVTGQDLPIHIVAEYYDGSEFVTNLDDVATPYSSNNLDYVPGSLTDNLTTSTITVTLGNGVIYQGETEDVNVTDVPLYLTAPGEGNDGSALLELDLGTPGLDFLQYDWRGVGDLVDENADGDYTDNPRALIEFGTYLQHQRIINWQELFITP